MIRFRVEDLLVNVLAGYCLGGSRCINTSLPNCTEVSLLDCAASLCGGQISLCAGVSPCGQVSLCHGNVSFCAGGTLIADCDAGCTLGTCSNACTYCSDECSKKATCEANKTTLRPSFEEDLSELAALKGHLASALTEIETRERSIAEKGAPRTDEEADQMERSLTETLERLRQEREDLPKSEPT